MLEAMAHFIVEPFAAYFALGENPKSTDRPRLAQAYILRTADDRLMAIHLSSIEKFWTGLVGAIEAPEFNADARFNERLARIANYDVLGAELGRRFKQRTLAEWMQRLAPPTCLTPPINNVSDVVDDPQAQHLGLIVPVEDAREGGKQSCVPPSSSTVNVHGQCSPRRCSTSTATTSAPRSCATPPGRFEIRN